MKSGRMRHKVTIQQDSSSDGDENPDYSGDPFAENVPCDVYEVAGLETWRGRQLESQTTHIIETRYYAGIDEKMRASFDSKTLHISKVLDLMGRKRYLQIHCHEVN